MPRPGLIPARNHWCLHNDQLAQEFDGILNLTQTFPGCRKVPEGAVFYAPLSSNLNELVGGYAYDYERQLEALYEPTPGHWRVAAENVPRFESGRLLMEPAGTNKCDVESFPDPGLTGYTLIAEGIMARVQDQPAELSAIGNGFCVDLDCRGVGAGRVIFEGDTGNTNAHTLSAWVKYISGDACLLQFHSGGQSQGFTNTDWERISVFDATNNTNTRGSLYVSAGARARVVFPQLEESLVLTSPIITRGASASRGVDQLAYQDASTFFNQAQGMVLVTYEPQFARSILPTGNRPILALGSYTLNLLYHDQLNAKSYDGTNNPVVGLPDFAAGTPLQLAVLYGPAGPSTFDVGINIGGWTWSTVQAYDGSFASQGLLVLMRAIAYGARIGDLVLYDVNNGRQWVEDNWP